MEGAIALFAPSGTRLDATPMSNLYIFNFIAFYDNILITIVIFNTFQKYKNKF